MKKIKKYFSFCSRMFLLVIGVVMCSDSGWAVDCAPQKYNGTQPIIKVSNCISAIEDEKTGLFWYRENGENKYFFSCNECENGYIKSQVVICGRPTEYKECVLELTQPLLPGGKLDPVCMAGQYFDGKRCQNCPNPDGIIDGDTFNAPEKGWGLPSGLESGWGFGNASGKADATNGIGNCKIFKGDSNSLDTKRAYSDEKGYFYLDEPCTYSSPLADF